MNDYLSTYFTISTIVCFFALMYHPSKLSPVNNMAGSIILSLVFGWILWPLVIVACIISIRKAKDAAYRQRVWDEFNSLTDEQQYNRWWASQDTPENPPPIHPKFDVNGKRI